jgi:ATP/ADP translocase
MLLLYFRLTGWKIGLLISGIVVIIGLIALFIFCKMKKTGESRGTVIGVAPVQPNVYRE